MKLKTHKGAKRRFRITGTGKILRAKSGRRHLLTNRTARRMRKLRRPTTVHKTQEKSIRRLLPYGGG